MVALMDGDRVPRPPGMKRTSRSSGVVISVWVGRGFGNCNRTGVSVALWPIRFLQSLESGEKLLMGCKLGEPIAAACASKISTHHSGIHQIHSRYHGLRRHHVHGLGDEKKLQVMEL